jgi:hypothetical protein
MSLYKWNWTSWWNDISGIWLNMWSKIITNSGATYPTNNLLFWKYKYNFTISDNPTNSSSIWSIFYIDAPEITVSTWNLDIGNLSSTEEKFSEWEITITVKTVGAWFDLILKKSQLMQNINWDSMTNWNWSKWVWYDTFPYSNTINKINIYEILANEWLSVNINWNKNIYTYKLKIGSFIDPEQAAGIYQTTVDFWIDLNY